MHTTTTPTDFEVASGERISREEFIRRLHESQARIRTLVPPEISLVDELIADRRAEAAREV